MMNNKPLVYIASPYTVGSESINASYQFDMFNQLMNDGLVIPFPPLMTHLIHSFHPRPYEQWLEWDEHILLRCDAILALNVCKMIGKEKYEITESNGRDYEIRAAQRNDIPVFYTIEDLEWWAKHDFPVLKLMEKKND